MAAMLLFYTIQRTTSPKFCIFRKSITMHQLYGPTASGATVDPSSQVYSSAMLVLPIVGNWKKKTILG
jgi:hypothetical protein